MNKAERDKLRYVIRDRLRSEYDAFGYRHPSLLKVVTDTLDLIRVYHHSTPPPVGPIFQTLTEMYSRRLGNKPSTSDIITDVVYEVFPDEAEADARDLVDWFG